MQGPDIEEGRQYKWKQEAVRVVEVSSVQTRVRPRSLTAARDSDFPPPDEGDSWVTVQTAAGKTREVKAEELAPLQGGCPD